MAANRSPLLLIFTGVVRGLLALGVIGILAAPVVLAAACTVPGARVAKERAGSPPGLRIVLSLVACE